MDLVPDGAVYPDSAMLATKEAVARPANALITEARQKDETSNVEFEDAVPAGAKEQTVG